MQDADREEARASASLQGRLAGEELRDLLRHPHQTETERSETVVHRAADTASRGRDIECLCADVCRCVTPVHVAQRSLLALNIALARRLCELPQRAPLELCASTEARSCTLMSMASDTTVSATSFSTAFHVC